MNTIICEDCGQPVETRRRNTKYCSICRLIRDAPFVAGRMRTCALCENSFAPMDIRDACCGDCSPGFPQHGETECAFCHETKVRARPDIAVCTHCARKPELRKKLFASLKHKQTQRKEANVR